MVYNYKRAKEIEAKRRRRSTERERLNFTEENIKISLAVEVYR
jgi:hypothetical protein